MALRVAPAEAAVDHLAAQRVSGAGVGLGEDGPRLPAGERGLSATTLSASLGIGGGSSGEGSGNTAGSGEHGLNGAVLLDALTNEKK